MQDAFGINVMKFIVKGDNTKSSVLEAIDEIKRDSEQKIIKFDEGRHPLYIALSDILFIEAEDKYTYVYMDGGERQMVRKSIKEWNELLEGYYFCQVHKSFIVSAKLFGRLGEGIGLPDGRKIQVGRIFREKTEKVYDAYLREKLKRG